LFVVLFVAAVVAFFRVGQWLVVEDSLAPADAIVVLSGGLPERAIEAARIYHQGFASEVWISQPASPAAEFAKLDIHYLGEDFYNEKILLALGVPPTAIRVLDQPAENTAAEVDEIAADMRADGASSCAIPMTIPTMARIGGDTRTTPWTSYARSSAC
jgi:uncharacterized SAM-binding protein YcdF (DUF218 family)